MKRISTFLILAIVAASVLAACGAEDSSEDGEALEAVKIAVAAPLTGELKAYGEPIEQGALAAAEEINANGGIPSGPNEGAEIEIVAFDDQLDPKQDADIAQQVVDDESFIAYTGLSSSDGALAAKPILARADVALVASYASSPQITEGEDNAFIVASPHGAYAYGAVEEASEAGAEQVAIIQITGEFGDSIAGRAGDE